MPTPSGVGFAQDPAKIIMHAQDPDLMRIVIHHKNAKVGACVGTAGAMLSGSKAPSQPRRALREHNAALPDRHLLPHARAPAAQIRTQ